MVNKTRQSSLYYFFALAYAFSWLAVFPLVADGLGWYDFPYPSWHLFGALGPTLAAWWLLRRREEARRAWLAGMRRWRLGRVGWLMALSPLLLAALAAIGLVLAGAPLDAAALGASARRPEWWLNLFIAAFAYGIFEEAGWRGYALPRLQRRHNALIATLILGLFWMVWHGPMFAYRFDLETPLMLGGFLFSLLMGAVWLTFLWNSTGGSTLATIVWHISLNLVSVGLAELSGDLVAIVSTLVIGLAIVALYVGRPTRLTWGEVVAAA